MIEGLEVARVMIPEEIWHQGPRAVNAEFARLFREHEPGQNAKGATPPVAAPIVPEQQVAAIEPIWENRHLTVSKKPIETSLSKQKFASALAGLRQELHEFADDISGETNIDERFVSFIRQLADRIPASTPPQNVLFQLGHMEEFFASYVKTVDAEWPAILASRYHALALHYDRTMRQSPLWREFKRNAAEKKLSQAQITAAKPLALETARTLSQDEAVDFVDSALPASLEQLAEPWRQAEVAEATNQLGSKLSPIEAGMELLAVDIVESVNNILKRIAEAALRAYTVAAKGLAAGGKELAEAGGNYAKDFAQGVRKAVKRDAESDGEKAVKWLRRIVIAGAVSGAAELTGAFAQLGQWIAKFPENFAWLERVLHYIK